ncbi:MAG: LysR family transcriptional regulator [Sphaerochaeta sp.]|jgi:molybdate transport system regulatory protein|nr:LysR family transcriptional regulator [Sphaerochaeta sp.]HAP57494.1 ModE family transcriptional regulator [Sphaerochaeta sp.]HBO35829.1 ModE family transcriptional regulator [Sphaerochaeta sp.]HPE92788.1 LysR family transcriptional regulator [Sphaerochaeta sp.]
MELKAKLYLVDEEGSKFMGIGVLWLLDKVAEHNSLRKAASALGISYSKAFAMVQNLEKSLGVAVLNRRKGGSSREGATLTAFAVSFLDLYRNFEKQAKKDLNEPFERFRQDLAVLLEAQDASGGEV